MSVSFKFLFLLLYHKSIDVLSIHPTYVNRFSEILPYCYSMMRVGAIKSVKSVPNIATPMSLQDSFARQCQICCFIKEL